MHRHASTPAIIAAKRARQKILIVFAARSDPISIWRHPGLAHPGGYYWVVMASDLSAKRLAYGT